MQGDFWGNAGPGARACYNGVVVDFILGIYLAALAVRGWLRGAVRELMDLVGLVVGAAIAFRLSAPVGGWLSDRFGASPEMARTGAGVVLFILFGLSLSILARYLSKVMSLPGLTMVNRVLGSGVAAVWGAVVVVVALAIGSVLPLPEAYDEAVGDSTVAQAVAGPDALIPGMLWPLVGDQAVAALAALEEVTGGRRVVPEEGERVETSPVDADELASSPTSVAFLADRVNADRLDAGADPLAWSDGLAEVARRRAVEMYRNGFVERRRPSSVLADTTTEGLRLERAEEMVALAATDRAAQEGIAAASDSALVDPGFDRVGIAAVQGPLGVLVVKVFGR